MDGYTRREPDPRGQASANGVKRWDPRQPADPRRAEAARRFVIESVLARESGLAQALGGALREQHGRRRECLACAARMAGAGALCGG
jgi:hypothetical protein